ncbi:MAG: hypothetical protein QOE44_1455 [Solirubrobacteraceae bacterium]|nr:hypothetical protein [Solirubrobacteraceae bacterium]
MAARGRIGLVAALAIGAVGSACGGATPAGSAGRAAAAEGLASARGYASYEGCRSSRSGACAGAVPAGLRRPLRIPRLPAGAPCPASGVRRVGFVGSLTGGGPVYPVLGSEALSYASPSPRSGFAGSRWGGGKVLWVADPGYRGPVLIRGRQEDGPHAVGFGGDRVPVAEVQLLAPGAVSPGEPSGWREWPSYTRLVAGGCYGYQVDGTTFSRVVAVRAVRSG